MPFTHVLVPTDFSDPAHQALTCALEEAMLHHARVTLLHELAQSAETEVYYVTGAPASQGYDPVAGARLSPSAPPYPTVVRRDYGEDALTQMRDLMPEGVEVPWEAEVAAGSPAETIIRVAEEKKVDLIVMGTHGRTGLQHVLLGSVAEKVVRLAPCPVLTIKHGRTQ